MTSALESTMRATFLQVSAVFFVLTLTACSGIQRRTFYFTSINVRNDPVECIVHTQKTGYPKTVEERVLTNGGASFEVEFARRDEEVRVFFQPTADGNPLPSVSDAHERYQPGTQVRLMPFSHPNQLVVLKDRTDV